MRNRPSYRDESQRYFPERDIDENETALAKRLLGRQAAPEVEPEPGFFPSRAERKHALSRLSDEIGKAVDAANERRQREREGKQG